MRRLLLLLFLVAACGPQPTTTPVPTKPVEAPVAVETKPSSPVVVTELHDLTMQTADCTKEPAKEISRADARADVAIVQRIVRRGWAGFETMSSSKDHHVDFDAIFAALEKWIGEQPEPIPVAAFQTHLVSVLAPAADNHMAVFEYSPTGHKNRRSVGSHENAYTADLLLGDLTKPDENAQRIVTGGAAPKGTRLMSCEGTPVGGGPYMGGLFRRTIIEGGATTLTAGYRPIVLSRTPPPPLKCTVKHEPIASPSSKEEQIELPMRPLKIGAAPPTTTSKKSGLPAFEIVERPTKTAPPIITLRSMWSGQLTELEAFVATAPRMRDAKTILVDVRGNSGGADMYSKKWFGALTTGKFASTVVDRLESEVTRQGIYNSVQCEIAEGQVTDEAAKKELQDRLQDAAMRLDTMQRTGTETFRKWQSRTSAEEGSAPKPFLAPLVILSDRHCASACESFLSMSKEVSNGIIIGENSGGVGVFGEVLVYRLPKSGLGFSAGMKYFHSSDPRREIPEGRGVLPDVWLDTNDALALSTKIADCLATGPKCPLTTALVKHKTN